MHPIDLRCEYRINPLGIDIPRPRLSWKLDSDRRGAAQTAFQVVAAPLKKSLLAADSFLWDSGKVDTDQSIHILYAGPALESRQRVCWQVRVWDETDHLSEWSAPAWFEMGLLHPQDWQAKWIGNAIVGGPRTAVPCPYFHREFTVHQPVRSARLYLTALGIYETSLNGQRIGENIFAPGWTDYSQRVQYQVYDVTALLVPGSNVITALLGDGWYCGHLAWEGRQIYGDRPKLFAQLEITLADGSSQTLVTDETWQTALSPILESDLLMGEAYDARLELPALDRPTSGTPALTFPHPSGLKLVAQNTPPTRAQGEIKPIADPTRLEGWPEPDWIFDFGQNLVGRICLKVRGPRGTTITLRFGEMLAENGRLYTANLRSARQTDYYTLKGDPNGEIYEPHFTFHGFRYVQVNGLAESPTRDLLTAIVIHSDNPPSFEFACSEPLLNQLFQNICWGWKGNSLDIPTDCPQRDERLGWTGDAQVFVKTATYLSDCAGFFSKWMQDLSDAQLDYGAIPAVAPAIANLKKHDGGAAWSDAFIIVPWAIWQQYGDTRLLATHYEGMCRYMDYLVTNSPGLIRLLPGQKELGEANAWQMGGFGDWLAQDNSSDRRGLTPRDLIGTAFLAYDAKLMSQMAAAIGKPADAARFLQLFKDARAAFARRFITSEGLLAGQTQTGYVLALHFDLVPDHLRPTLTAALVADIQSRQQHMSTGFVGTPYICQVLADASHTDLAYALLLQKTFPSWLYPVLHGATTIWERWDGWTEERGFQDPGMNSFNHYAYGAVGTWMVENVAGIRSDPQNPGFKQILLQPRFDGPLTYARGEYRSPYGLIRSHWQKEGDTLTWDVTIPPNSSAIAHLPGENSAEILEGAVPVEDSPGLKVLQTQERSLVVALQSGSYHFRMRPAWRAVR